MSRYKSYVFLICTFYYYIVSANENVQSEKSVLELKASDFAAFKEPDYVRIVYFHKKALSRLPSFYKEYEKAASILTNYNVKLAKVDCTVDPVESFCNIDKVEQNVYSFKNGEELLPLSLETMFDFNSIVSNVLQLVLLREVPILQSVEERTQYEDKYKGQSDIIFSFQNAIGTYEHRILMEVAYAYLGQFQFALTTERKTVSDFIGGKEGDYAIWVLHCKEAEKDQPCRASLYRDNMDMTSFAKFLKAISKPLINEVTGKEDAKMFGGIDLHTLYMFYTGASEKQVKNLANVITSDYFGVVGVALIDVRKVDVNIYAPSFPANSLLPAVGFSLWGVEKLEMMQAPLSDKNTLNFVQTKLAEVIRPLKQKIATDDPEEETVPDDILAAEKQDDPVALAVLKLKKKEIDLKHVPALTDKTFFPTTKNAKFLVVLYYLSFDARSMAFLRSYADVSKFFAESNSYPLARIECFDWTDVCGKENITSYPTIRIFRMDREAVPYKGMLDKQQLINAIQLYKADSPLELTSKEDVQSFVEGNLPADIKKYTHTAVLGLFSHKKDSGIKAFSGAALRLEGKVLFGAYAGEHAREIGERYKISTPGIVVVKRDDEYQSFVPYTGEFTEDSIVEFILQAKLPIFPQLTMYNFPAYFALKQPFALLFAADIERGSGLHHLIGTLAQSGVYDQLSFAWMDVNLQKTITSEVLSSYDPSVKPPAFVVVNHQKGFVHIFPAGEEWTESALTSWLKKVLADRIHPTRMLEKKEWKPLHPGYDFLKMMEEDRKKQAKDKSSTDEELDFENEEGLMPYEGEPADSGLDDREAEIRDELQDLHKSRLYHKRGHKQHSHDPSEL